MAFTRNQTENMSRDELVEEFIKLSYASTKFSNLTEKFSDFGIYQKTVIPTAKKDSITGNDNKPLHSKVGRWVLNEN